MIWRSKHQDSDQIKEKSVFWKNWMFRFAKPDSPIFGRCAVQQSILLNQVQQNWMVQFLRSEGLEFQDFGRDK
jgi:hypothetical protein